jgi:hypothetical protein
MTEISVHRQITQLAYHILEVESGSLRVRDDGSGYDWKGDIPIFSSPIAINNISFNGHQPIIKSGFIEFDDTRVAVGLEVPFIVGRDPLCEYLLEGVEQSFSKHPHVLCVEAIRKMQFNIK